jgi:hypothetical protein
VDRAHDAHEATIARHRSVVDGVTNAGADAVAQRAIRDGAIEALGRLEAVDTSRLIFGRLDYAEGRVQTVYVGPCTVARDDEIHVVDFTRPIARAFYAADDDDPLGLTRRRSFDLLGRELRDISDEYFGAASAEPSMPAARRSVLDRVAAELERAREPQMQTIVASIVADQYRLIEAPRAGLFIVQGGPGTGKTAVALHRAVYLMRNNEDLGKVLVVGPNAAFMAYIAGVLPGLGETTVDQLPIDRLAETADVQIRGSDPPVVATLKGDARMAQVLKNAARQRVRPATEPYSLSTQGALVVLEPDVANGVLERELQQERPYMEGRRRFVEAIRDEVESLLESRFERSVRHRTVDRTELQRHLANDRSWLSFVERMWPTMSPPQLVHDMFTIEQRLRAAASGVLTDAEISMLVRHGVRTVGVHPWAVHDMPLLDEAQALVQGAGFQYGYVIVDEAQDLTPMQLRMVARRSKDGDLTVVGDIAQATGPTRYGDWDEIARHLPSHRGVRVDRLTIGYRVPRSIMELANLVLPQIAPDLPVTEPVREARVEPQFVRAEGWQLADAVATIVAEAAADERSVGVIVPQTHVVEIRGGLAALGLAAGDISTDQLEKRVTLLSSTDAKGLEFDRVVVVEPWDIVTGAQAGWSELYVALSRATQQLVIVHSRPLPAPLPGGEPIVPPALAAADALAASSGADEDAIDDEAPVELDLDLDLGFDGDDVGTTETVSGEPAPPPLAPEPTLSTMGSRVDEGTVASGPPADEASTDSDTAEEHAAPAASESAIPAAAADLPAAARHFTRERTVAPRVHTTLGGAFSEAVVYAKVLHDGATRRGTAVPYLSHLLATAALVLEDGGTETEAIAALLHDAVEDGAPGTADVIRTRFGVEVADIVIGCSDPEVPGGFREAKTAHLGELERGSTSMRRVALAEKLDNARALLSDLERYGAATWSRMNVERDDMLWYLESLVALFDRTFPSVLAGELRRVLTRIEEQAR